MCQRVKAKNDSEKLITGYGIGGCTPLLHLWNEDGFTKQDIVDLWREWKGEISDKQEIIQYCVESHNDLFEDGEEEDITLGQFLDLNLQEWKNETNGVEGVVEALQDLVNFVEDYEDELQNETESYVWEEFCNLVGYAHRVIDQHIRKVQYGDCSLC